MGESATTFKNEFERDLPPVNITAEIQQQLDQEGLVAKIHYENGKCPAEFLLAVGYRVINRVGQAERPIAGFYPEIEKDFSNKALLTQEDVEVIQSTCLPPGHKKNTHIIGEGMCAFLDEAYEATVFSDLLDPKSRKANEYRNFINKLLAINNIKAGVEGYDVGYDTIMGSIHQNLKTFNHTIQNLPQTVRGVALAKIVRRGEGSGVVGSRSPVLASSKIFSSDDKVGIIINDAGDITGTQVQVRLNAIVAELAKVGISESQDNCDPTQRYLTIKEFLKLDETDTFDITNLPNVRIAQRDIMIQLTNLFFKEVGIEVNQDWLEAMASEHLFVNTGRDTRKDLELIDQGPSVTKIKTEKVKSIV